MGFDRERNEWRTAKKKTYPPALCQVLAHGIVDAVNHMYTSCPANAWPEDMREGEDVFRGALSAFYVAWDPYLGLDEGWAPDFVDQKSQQGRADPERSRFLPPTPSAVP